MTRSVEITRRTLARLGAGAALALASGARPAQAALGPTFLGINTLWPPGDETSLRDRFTRARALGLIEVRTDWEWRLGEPRPGEFDWRAFDRLVRIAHETGVSVLPIVHYAPEWALPQTAKGAGISELAPTDAGFDAFGGFLARCVERYGPGGNAPIPFEPIIHWQIWNEPNNKDFWGPEPQPERFVRMMRRVTAALAPYRDRIRIVHAGLSKADLTFLWQLWEVDRNYGETFDIMAVHPYIFDWWAGVRSPDAIDPDSGPEAALGFIGDKSKPNYLAKVFNLQLFMTLRGVPQRPIWITEMGFFVSRSRYGVSEQRQATLLADTMDFIKRRLTDTPFGQGNRALPANVQRVYWFALDDYPMPDDYGNFGLYRADRTPRASAETLRRLIQ